MFPRSARTSPAADLGGDARLQRKLRRVSKSTAFATNTLFAHSLGIHSRLTPRQLADLFSVPVVDLQLKWYARSFMEA